jgi:glycolate oxidase
MSARRRNRRRPKDPVVAALEHALSPDRVRVDSAERALFAHDASVFAGGLSGPICFVTSAAEVQAVMRIAIRHDRAVVPRGAGTGLAGGAIPLGAPIVVSTTKMNRILEVDTDNQVAWVEPGVVNLDLSKHLRPMGYHFAPDPSSQQVCTIGGNVANNSGGPHCLAYGVTSHHVVALEVVLSDGELVILGGLDAEPGGYDLRGAFVGGEGTLGIATRIAVRITPNPPVVRTLLASFSSAEAAAKMVGDVIAAGIVPGAMEMMDQKITRAVENFVHAGYPTDAGAVLLVEVDGQEGGTRLAVDRIMEIGRADGALSIRVAATEEERALLWKGRKGAFGAVAQIAPAYYLHDTVVPRSALAGVLHAIYEIGAHHDLQVVNVFHAGDGNLHPLLLFNPREPGVMDRVHHAGKEIVEVSLAAGGVLSGEHGIGIEKQEYMSMMFSDVDLEHQNRLRRAFDPACRANPGKVMPASHSCADIQALREIPVGVWG